jgi:hypothetical protein
MKYYFLAEKNTKLTGKLGLLNEVSANILDFRSTSVLTFRTVFDASKAIRYKTCHPSHNSNNHISCISRVARIQDPIDDTPLRNDRASMPRYFSL